MRQFDPSIVQPAAYMCRSRNARSQQGLSLIVVLMILVVASILGVAGIQISVLGEKATRNDRDIQIAWQSAEAGLTDAELDILGQYSAAASNSASGAPAPATTRALAFKAGAQDASQFLPGCGGAGPTQGLCSYAEGSALPDWLAVDFTDTSSNARTVELGTFTGRSFAAGSAGLQPAVKPRYVIELLSDPTTAFTTSPQNRTKYVYRVTAMGSGPNANTRAVVQMIYRN